jgi:hypothetical protein
MAGRTVGPRRTDSDRTYVRGTQIIAGPRRALSGGTRTVRGQEDTKAEVTRRWVVLDGEGETEEAHWISTAPQTTFWATLQFTEDKGPREGRVSALGEGV